MITTIHGLHSGMMKARFVLCGAIMIPILQKDYLTKVSRLLTPIPTLL